MPLYIVRRYGNVWKKSKFLKLINIRNTYVQKTGSAVRIEGTLLSFFGNKTELKQGDSLSPILFKLTLRKVIQGIKIVSSSIRIGKEELNILAYADDIA
jgi:hypothetical protein